MNKLEIGLVGLMFFLSIIVDFKLFILSAATDLVFLSVAGFILYRALMTGNKNGKS